ncbi:hypothetical protein BT63DRAFT_430425 [Microthyrium microscopicum]|uniref:Fumarylacetoacetase-like C-terminal domain-containing protein n=1 Tax=Microthyrium microscopicum TaxID=703497 RepID=A0A6A6TT39_9PEZI|nr:hypothetical protein BT63DRAFT_430425 [Microthyrium microscopicum]
MAYSRLVRFIPKSSPGTVLIGQPVDDSLDVGLATRKGEEVEVRVFSGSSALSPGELTNKREKVGTLLSPISREEIGTIRCIGLNYKDHAREVKMDFPSEPILFLKPNTSLADPYPAPTIIPKHTLAHNTADYESELAVVIGKECKNVSEADALSYVLGYTACNDVSSRTSQLSQSQWCYSKGFDGACPLGPVLVSPELIKDPSKLWIKGKKNGEVVQDSGIDDLIFEIPKLISFLSQGTTLPPGTTIVTGTPKGVGMGTETYLKDGDEVAIEVSPHIGTLITVYQAEK